MKEDRAIEETRSIRKQISKECDDAPHQLVQHSMRRQKTNVRRLRKTMKRSSLRSES
ncbi:MAG: hypothetical protein ABFD90_02435 [Phycisphaerales bacterium]